MPPEVSGVINTLRTKSHSPTSPLAGSIEKSASLIGRVRTSSRALAVPFRLNIDLMSRAVYSP
jgi:hypothetical protein